MSDVRDPVAAKSAVLSHLERGQYAEALIAAEAGVAACPHDAALRDILGVLRCRDGDVLRGRQSITTAIALTPGIAVFHLHLGDVDIAEGHTPMAKRRYVRAARIAPGYEPAVKALATTAIDLGIPDEAIGAFTLATVLNPSDIESWRQIAILLSQVSPSQGSWRMPARLAERILALDPADPIAPLVRTVATERRNTETAAGVRRVANLADAEGDFQKSSFYLMRLLANDPADAGLLNNGGLSLVHAGAVQKGVHLLRAAVNIAPNMAMAHFNLGIGLLKLGQFKSGWREFDWRWRTPELGLNRSGVPTPLWNGEDLNGKRIFVYSEQGFGDVIQFVRLLRPLRARGGKIIFQCHRPQLLRLLSTVPDIDELVPPGDTVPAHDYQIPLLTLPVPLSIDEDSIPVSIPYLSAELADTRRWANRLVSVPHPRVGVAWAGARGAMREIRKTDHRRSLRLDDLNTLFAVPGLVWFSLQVGEAADELTTLPPALRPIDWTSALRDFADTAALVDQLDLVITVDTAVAHLAGALGKPVWVLSRHDGCWRWMMDRDDSPWYPTLRLFRQEHPGDWAPVVQRLATALSCFAEIWSPNRGDTNTIGDGLPSGLS